MKSAKKRAAHRGTSGTDWLKKIGRGLTLEKLMGLRFPRKGSRELGDQASLGSKV